MKKKKLPEPAAVNDWICERSVALLLEPEEGGMSIGSAVAVEVCGRYFLLTAAHNLEGIVKREQLRALPGGKRLERPLHILEWNSVLSVEGAEYDVAWLEVESVSAAASSTFFVGSSVLLCGAVHQENTIFLVHGYPGAMVDREDVFEGIPLLCGTSVFSFSLRSSVSSFPFQEGIDLLLEWPPSDLRDSQVEVPSPSGVSGGGVWLLPRHSDHPEWTIADLRLVAINRAWRRGSRQLVATKIEHCLALLAQDKPYTRRELSPLLEGIEL